ncbi:MAG: hypothetical protein AAGA08_16980 [Pseudomonadota bacterium]
MSEEKLQDPLSVLVQMPSRVDVSNRAETTIIEKRAATDESVALLKEMERAAQDKVIEALRLDNNTFDGALHAEFSAMDQNLILKIVFDINGKRLVVEHVCGARDSVFDKDKTAPLAELRDKMAARIAAEILADAFDPLKHGAFLA